MDGGNLVYPLPLITAVVDARPVAVLLQRLVADLRPRRPPFLGLGLLVPVGGGNGFAFVLPLFSVIDFLTLLVKNVLLFLLRSPFAALVKGAHGQHDMGVRVAVTLVMYADVGTHSRRHKMLIDILADKRNILLPRQFYGQGKLDFPRKLGVFRFLNFLHRVP